MHALTLLLFVCSASMHLMHGCAAVVAFTCTFFGYLGCKTTVGAELILLQSDSVVLLQRYRKLTSITLWLLLATLHLAFQM
jgi:hypothetical protein